MPSSVRTSQAWRRVSQSDLLPITTPTSGARGTSIAISATPASPDRSGTSPSIRRTRGLSLSPLLGPTIGVGEQPGHVELEAGEQGRSVFLPLGDDSLLVLRAAEAVNRQA